MIIIDTSTSWSHVYLLSTCNMAFARLLAQIIKLRAQFPYCCINIIRPDNASELCHYGKLWNQKHIVVDNVFAYNVAIEIIKQDGDLKPKIRQRM